MVEKNRDGTCGVCKQPTGAGPYARYCPEHRAPWIQRVTTKCVYCGKDFEQRPAEGKRFCSSSCSGSAHVGRKARTRVRDATCVVCGGSFSTHSGKAKWCSPGCRPKPVPVSRITKTCPECGIEFTGKKRNATYCSNKCYWNTKRRKRRAIKRGCEASTVSRWAIAERDGFLCALCGQPVDMSLACPDRMSATLDHVHPISLGGDHSESNLQLAHYGCNSVKGNRVA